MPDLRKHQSSQTTKLLLIGDPGCLAGDTIVSCKRGTKPRKMSLLDVYKRFHGKHHNKQDLPTYLLADKGGYVGMVRMLDVVKSGEKEVFELRTVQGKSITASADHQFSTPMGWLPLSALKPGMQVICWRGTRDKEIRRRELPQATTEKRAYVYSIPYHPFAMQNWVAGRDYKRAPRARLVVEAAMNGLTLEEFIKILRTEPNVAASLQYSPAGVDFHHLDGNWLNDELSNIAMLDSQEHKDLHHEQMRQEAVTTHAERIESITPKGVISTFDVMMAGPEHNFIANGIVVHNSGKTGALASLASAGYNLRVIDLDNGVDILANLLGDPKGPYGPEALDRVKYVTITDPMRNTGGKLIPTKASVWQRTAQILQNWKVEDEELGPLTSWTPQEVLVIDSLTRLSGAAMNFILAMNGRLGQKPWQSDYYEAQMLVETLLQMLYDEGIKCNVVIISHVALIGDEGAPTRGYPMAVGKALPPKVGSYFNTVAMAKTSGVGAQRKQRIITKSDGVVELKNSAPNRVKQDYPLESGLAELFRDLRGEGK